ncbi:MAG: PD40 domain-containing protein, partial [Acidobacteria bacterium]|nr:PD40 domain-containing protein [Acidobacteriota bacterium]
LAGVSPHYVSTGHLVYAVEDGSVRAVPFDATLLEVTGSPVPLVEGIAVKNSGAANFSISDNGRLVYVLGTGGGGRQRSLVWVDRDGREEAISDRRGDFRAVRLSPDGRRLALEVAEDNLLNIWLLGIEDDTFAPLNNEGISQAPLWTLDGEKVLFNWAEGGGGSAAAAFGGIYWRDANFGAEREQVLQADGGTFPLSWSEDGEDLVLHEMIDGRQGQRRILVMPIEGAERTPSSPLDPSGQFNQRSPMVSPDGRWVAYMSSQSGRDEVYVRPFPEGGRRVQVSNNGGVEPMWGTDSSELFYREIDAPTTTMIAARLRPDPELRVVGREELFTGGYYFMGNTARTVYDYDRQNDRFLMVLRDEGQIGDSPQINVVLNWTQELLERVPVP